MSFLSGGFIGDAPSSDSVDATDLRLAFLMIAENAGDRLNMIDGIVDPFKDESDVDTGTSTYESYDSSGDFYSPTDSSETFNSSGTYTASAGGSTVSLTIWGGGASGGGPRADSGCSASGGGGGGYTAATQVVGSSEAVTVTIGAGGVAATVGNIPNSGGTSSFGSYASANGAAGSSQTGSNPGGVGSTANGGTGAAALCADYTEPGGGGGEAGGGSGVGDGGSQGSGSTGGAGGSGVGDGGDGGAGGNNSSAGAAGTAPGGGGGGGGSVSSGVVGAAAGAGAAGRIVVTRKDNMILVSDAFTADSAPATGRIHIQAKPIDSITLNTDLTAEISRNGGTTFTAATLVAKETLADGTIAYEDASVDISGQSSAVAMKWRIKTLNSKDIEVHGVVLQWA
jgi:hypothetical protein